MATKHATARFHEPSAMQLNHIGIAEDANKKTGRYLLVDLSATGSATDAQRKSVAPAHTARSCHSCRSGAGSVQSSSLR
jgi:hypothetical protein